MVSVNLQACSGWEIAQQNFSKKSYTIKLYYDLISDLRSNRDTNLIRLEKNYLIRIVPAYKSNKKIFQFVSAAEFKLGLKKLMDKNDVQTAAALVVMFCSGRRMVDCSRVSSGSIIRRREGVFDCVLPRDKTNAQPVNFTIDLSVMPADWRPNSVKNIDIWFQELVDKFSRPFGGKNSSNLGRFLKFNPHSVRSIACINFSMLGLSDQAVMSRIGWAPDENRAMLRRYRKVCVDFGEQSSLSGCLKKMNSVLSRAG